MAGDQYPKGLNKDATGIMTPAAYDPVLDDWFMNTRLVGSGLLLSHTTVAVGTTSILALQANLKRRYLLLINDSDTNIYLSFGLAAANGQGIRLNANGGSYELTPGIISTAEIYAISNAGTKNLLITEGI